MLAAQSLMVLGFSDHFFLQTKQLKYLKIPYELLDTLLVAQFVDLNHALYTLIGLLDSIRIVSHAQGVAILCCFH